MTSNIPSEGELVSCDLTQFGYAADDELTVRDVWSGEVLKTMKPGLLSFPVNVHSVRLLRISSKK